MATLSDNEVIQQTIELFLVRHFDNLEFAGTVKFEKRDDINYFSVDLRTIDWGDDLTKLHSALYKHLTEWVKTNGMAFEDYTAVATLIIEYLLPEKDNAIQNQSKMIRLFYLPSYYYGKGTKTPKKFPRWVIPLLKVWYHLLRRNVILVSIPTIIFMILAIKMNSNDTGLITRLSKAFDYVNVASGIIASFVLAYLINKVITIRQEKLKHTDTIKHLGNQLTYFRAICYDLVTDHNFWDQQGQWKASFKYADSLKQVISYEEYCYPNYHDDVAYAKYQSVQKDDISQRIVSLILQLNMLSGSKFLHEGLSYTNYPSNRIYSLTEMEQFALFHDANQIEYCTNGKYLPETFPKTYGVVEILKNMERIDPKYKAAQLTRAAFEQLSLDYQYDIIPRLYKLTKYVEAALPATIRYFKTAFSLLLLFGIIVPSLLYIFIANSIYPLLTVFIVIAIIGHILLSLPAILTHENTLDPKKDYF